MTEQTKQTPSVRPHGFSAHFQQFFEGIAERAHQHGLGRDAAEALVGIDGSAFAWRRRTMKHELVRGILEALALDIEQAEFEALTAISRLTLGIGVPPKASVTIGDLGEELSIDPSHASRLAAGLVQKGYARRAAAQDDGRKSVLVLTAASMSLLQAFMTLKWDITIKAFSSWEEQDILDFERLLSRYLETIADVSSHPPGDTATSDRLHDEVTAALKAELEQRTAPAD